MTPYTLRRPYMPTYQEVLEVRDDHIEDVPAVCQRVMEISRTNIKAKLFEDDIVQLALVESMIVKLRNIVQYRQMRRQGVRHT